MSLFISFEGLDGGGKSTQAALLAKALRGRGKEVLHTRDPGTTALGEELRRFILDPDSPAPTPKAMSFLLSAARAQLVDESIAPALERHEIVIADRYTDSTIAYQGFGLGLDRDALDCMIAFSTNGIRPDLVIFIDIEPEDGMRRSGERGERNRLDSQAADFYARVKEGYDYLATLSPQRWRSIDGSRPVEQVHQAVLAAVEPSLVASGVSAT